MDYEQIEKLIDKVNKSKITELSVEEGNFKLNIKAEPVSYTHLDVYKRQR